MEFKKLNEKYEEYDDEYDDFCLEGNDFFQDEEMEKMIKQAEEEIDFLKGLKETQFYEINLADEQLTERIRKKLKYIKF